MIKFGLKRLWIDLELILFDEVWFTSVCLIRFGLMGSELRLV